MALTVEAYLARVDAAALRARLGGAEGPARGEPARPAAEQAGIAEAAVGVLLPAGAMNPAPAVLGICTGPELAVRVEAGLRARGLHPRWFALEATPDGLRAVAAAMPAGVGFLGAAGDVARSVEEARSLQPLPPLFHGALATVEPADWPEPSPALRSCARVLAHGAPMAVAGGLVAPAPERVAAMALDAFHRAEVRQVAASSSAQRVAMLELER